jgi:hypothetical protein
MPFDLDCRDVTRPGTVDHGRDLAGLMHLAAELGDTERAVLQLVAERLKDGQERYGRFDLATDRRDFRHESLEEIADALVYAACGLMRWPAADRGEVTDSTTPPPAGAAQ